MSAGARAADLREFADALDKDRGHGKSYVTIVMRQAADELDALFRVCAEATERAERAEAWAADMEEQNWPYEWQVATALREKFKDAERRVVAAETALHEAREVFATILEHPLKSESDDGCDWHCVAEIQNLVHAAVPPDVEGASVSADPTQLPAAIRELIDAARRVLAYKPNHSRDCGCAHCTRHRALRDALARVDKLRGVTT